MSHRYTPSDMDVYHLAEIRKNVDAFIEKISSMHRSGEVYVLDIAPQIHKGAKYFFSDNCTIETMDIDHNSGATYIADITKRNNQILEGDEGKYDVIICTEVLEHVINPFSAIEEIFRLLKPSGIVAISTPFNFRIHGPLPDCWRFTEHGLRALLKEFDSVEIEGLDTHDRPLMPIHYTATGRRPARYSAEPRKVT